MLAVYSVSCILFLVLFERLHLVRQTRMLFAAMREAMGVVSNNALNDDDKEVAVQRHAVAALRGVIMLTVGLFATLMAAATPPLVSDWMGLIELDAFIDFSLNPWVLLATVVILGAFAWMIRRIWPAAG